MNEMVYYDFFRSPIQTFKGEGRNPLSYVSDDAPSCPGGPYEQPQAGRTYLSDRRPPVPRRPRGC